MSDLEIEIQESLHEFAQFLFGELKVLQGATLIYSNLIFEFIEPSYRLDANVKVLTDRHIPIARIVYSKN